VIQLMERNWSMLDSVSMSMILLHVIKSLYADIAWCDYNGRGKQLRCNNTEFRKLTVL
jgi:hypothetical protein